MCRYSSYIFCAGRRTHEFPSFRLSLKKIAGWNFELVILRDCYTCMFFFDLLKQHFKYLLDNIGILEYYGFGNYIDTNTKILCISLSVTFTDKNI